MGGGHLCSLTSAEVTVSALQAQRRQGWARAGRPGWERWWLSGLSEVNHEPTGMVRRRQSGVPLRRYGHMWS